MIHYKLSEATAARRRWPFVCVDDADGKTAEPGLTFAAGELQISKNGAAYANAAGTVTEKTDGSYNYEATAAELDTFGFLEFKIEKAGVRTTIMVPGQVVAFDPYDGVRAGLTALPSATPAAVGGLLVRSATSQSNAVFVSAAGNVASDVYAWLGSSAPPTTIPGVPEVDVTHYLGAVPSVTRGTAGTALPAIEIGQPGGLLISAPASNSVVAVDNLGNVQADLRKHLGSACPAVTVAGVPKVDLSHYLGAATPALIGGRLDTAEVVRSGTAQGGAASSITLDAGASAVDSFYKHTKIAIASGTGAGQVRGYSSYVGATKVFTVDSAWATNPDATSVFVLMSNPSAVFGAGAISLASFTADALLGAFGVLNSGTLGTASATSMTLGATASADNGDYVDGIALITGGTGAGQLNQITGYVGATKVAAVAKTWAVVPDSTSTYTIFKNGNPHAVARALLEDFNVEGSHKLGDMVRLIAGVLAGKVLNFTTGTLAFKSLDGAKTRLTITKDATGRLTSVVGDLTP